MKNTLKLQKKKSFKENVNFFFLNVFKIKQKHKKKQFNASLEAVKFLMYRKDDEKAPKHLVDAYHKYLKKGADKRRADLKTDTDRVKRMPNVIGSSTIKKENEIADIIPMPEFMGIIVSQLKEKTNEFFYSDTLNPKERGEELIKAWSFYQGLMRDYLDNADEREIMDGANINIKQYNPKDYIESLNKGISKL